MSRFLDQASQLTSNLVLTQSEKVPQLTLEHQIYGIKLIYIKCKPGMLLMSLKAAFEADYALLATIGQLIVMFGQKV